MIPFDSLEGRILRDVDLSRSAILSLWASALEMNQMDWAEWALAQPIPESDPNKIALRFLQAATQGNNEQMRLLGIVLKSLPSQSHDLFYVRSAMTLLNIMAA